MDQTNTNLLPAGRVAVRWFIFLVFFHLLPVPWFVGVAGGLAPNILLFAAGVASLFNTDFDSFAIAAFFLIPALVTGLILVLAAYVIAWAVGRIGKPIGVTLSLVIILVVCIGIALCPVYVSGGHGGSQQINIFGFIDILNDARVPTFAYAGYLFCLAILLIGLLVYQHTPQRFPTLPLDREQRRRILRWSAIGAIAVIIILFGWVHRTLFFLKPLADMGFAGAQYRLALTLQEKRGSEYRPGASSRKYLELAAQQGHLEATLLLARYPRSSEDKLRWLTVAAEGGFAEAQYELYRLMIKKGLTEYKSRSAADWLHSAVDGGFADAQYDLGRLQIYGKPEWGIEKNKDKARQWWEKAAESGHGRAMEELAWRYAKAADGFPWNPKRAIALFEKIADGYQNGLYGLSFNQKMAFHNRKQAEEIRTLEVRIAGGDPEALASLGRQLLRSETNNMKGLTFLEKAANTGDAGIQHELGAIYLFGRYGIVKDLKKGRRWWDLALEQKHVKTMEHVALAYQNGRFGYPVDLLKSKTLTELLVEAYRNGRYGVDPDIGKERYWAGQLKHLERLFDLAGGSYLPLDDLRRQAEAGDLKAQYQLGRQMLVTGSAAERQKGLQWIAHSADGGYAEAQYRIATYYENKTHIMRDHPARGVAFLQSAAEQNHLNAMGTLALAYEKGRYGLAKDYQKAQYWYQKLLHAYASNQYLGDVDERFIKFQRSRLEIVTKARKFKEDRARRYEQADPLERQIMDIEDRYHQEFQTAVNRMVFPSTSREGIKRYREEVSRLRQEYNRRRDLEIEKVKREAAEPGT